MSITLDLSDEVVEQLNRLSETTGETIEEIVIRGVRAQILQPVANPIEAERAALARLLQYAGCIDSGTRNSGDNLRIDEDLSRAYAGPGEAP